MNAKSSGQSSGREEGEEGEFLSSLVSDCVHYLKSGDVKSARKFIEKAVKTYRHLRDSLTLKFLTALIDLEDAVLSHHNKPSDKTYGKAVSKMNECLHILKRAKPKRGEKGLAAKEYRSLLGDWRIMELLVGLMKSLYRLDEVLELLNLVLEVNPENYDALIAKITVLADLGRYREAVDLCREKLSSFPNDEELAVNLAINLVGYAGTVSDDEVNRLIEEARDHAQEVLSRNPRNCNAYYALALTYAMQRKRDLERALSVTDEPFKQGICGENEKLLLLRANLLRDTRRYDEAVKVYNRILETNEMNAEAWEDLATLWRRIGEYQKFLECERNAYMLDKYDESKIEWYAVALRFNKKYQEALNVVNEGLRMYPDSYKLLLEKARIFKDAHEWDEAEKYYRKVMSMKLPESDAGTWSNIWVGLAEIYYVHKKHKNKDLEALEYINKALELSPDYPYALYVKGVILRSLGRVKEALEHFEMVYELDDSPRTKKLMKEEIEETRRML